MFDDLDDPAFAGPRPGARDAVAARAGQIRRHRRIGAAAGLASFVVLLALTSAGLRSLRSDSLKQIAPVAPGTPTAEASPTPSPSPSATPTPTRATTRPPAPTASPAPNPPAATAGAARTTAPARRPAVDVVKEWLGLYQIESCRPAAALPPRQGRLEAAGLSMTLDLPAEVDGQDPEPARLVFTNNTDARLMFSYLGSGGGPVHTIASGAGGFSGETYQDAVGREGGGRVDLAAGETDSIPVTVLTDTCAPHRSTKSPGSPALLPPGSYQVSAGIMITEVWYWSPPEDDASTSPSPSPTSDRPKVYSTVPLTVTVT